MTDAPGNTPPDAHALRRTYRRLRLGFLIKRRRNRQVLFALGSAGTAVMGAGTAMNIHADGPLFVTVVGLLATPWLMIVTSETSRKLGYAEREIDRIQASLTND